MLRNGRGPLFPRTYASCLGAPHKDSRRLQPGRLKREPIACVASGISRASAFVLVAKRWRRVAKPWEDWWRVQASPLANSLAGEDSRAKPAREWQLYHRSRAHESRQLRRLGSPVYWRLGYCDSQNLTQVSHWPLFTGCSCFLPLGMESGHLHDSALSASASYDGNHSPQKSRLNTASRNGIGLAPGVRSEMMPTNGCRFTLDGKPQWAKWRLREDMTVITGWWVTVCPTVWMVLIGPGTDSPMDKSRWRSKSSISITRWPLYICQTWLNQPRRDFSQGFSIFIT